MESLCRLVCARNGTWGGAIRLDSEGVSADLLQGWRVAAMATLRTAPADVQDAYFKEILRQWDRREIDPSFLLPMRGVGTFRTYSFRRELSAKWFSSPFYANFYAAAGTYDAVFVAFPLNADAESHFGFYSDRIFTDDEIEILAFALRGVKWLHRQITLGYGLLLASAPLTPSERKIAHLLLTEASEKRIAEQLGLAVSTVHQHVVSIFRKFGVRSRAGLVSLWLNRGG